MEIKKPRCRIFFYNDSNTYFAYDLKSIVAVVLKGLSVKKAVEYLVVDGADETNSEVSVRLDFGSIVSERADGEGPLSGPGKVNRLLGELLVEMGTLTKSQLDECLALQASTPGARKLGEIIIEKKYAGPDAIVSAVTRQLVETFGRPESGPGK